MADFDPYHVWLGIPPTEQPANHYRLLGLNKFESNPDVIESAADRQMTHVRSFQSGARGDLSQRILNEIAKAKLALLDPHKRASYDDQLRQHDQSASNSAVRPKPIPTATPLPAENPAPVVNSVDVNSFPVHVNSESLKRQGSKSGGKVIGGLITAVVLFTAAAMFIWQPWNASHEIAQGEAEHGEELAMPAETPAEAPEAEPTKNAPTGTTPIESPRRITPSSALPSTDSPSTNEPEPESSPDDIVTEEPGSVEPVVEPSPSPTESTATDEPVTEESVVEESVVEESPAAEALESRQPIPVADSRNKARKKIMEVFPIAEAHEADERAQLATTLIETARETKSDLASRFAMLNLARELAAEAAKMRLANTAIDLLETDFEFNGDQVRMATFNQALRAPVPTSEKNEVYELGVVLFDDLVSRDEINQADELLPPLLLAVRRARNRKLLDLLVERKRQLDELLAAQKQVVAARKTLEADADDPAANQVVGRYLTFLKGDWKVGLAHLAKSNSEHLADVAAADLAEPTATDEMANVAGGWYTAAVAESDNAVQHVCLAQSLYWYEKSLGELNGLKKARAEKRLTTISDALAGTSIAAFRAKEATAEQPTVAAKSESPRKQPEQESPFAKITIQGGRRIVPLRWEQGMPPQFQGAQVNEYDKNGMLQFTVDEPGIMYMIAGFPETVYEGNTGGGWYERRTTRKQLLAAGWRELGPWQWEKGRFLFMRPVNKGSYSLQTNKYCAPRVILFPSNGTGLATGSGRREVDSVPLVAENLLRAVDPDRHAQRLNWTRIGDGLKVPHGQGGLLEIPVSITGSYELEVEFTRHGGTSVIGYVLPVGGKHDAVVISPTFAEIDGLAPDVRSRREFANGRRYRLQIRVQSSGRVASITVRQGNQQIISWSGALSKLNVADIRKLSAPGRLGLYAHDTSTTFHSVKLTMLQGKAYLTNDAVIPQAIASTVPGPSLLIDKSELKELSSVLGADDSLLSIVDPARDAKRLAWSREGEAIKVPNGRVGILELPVLLEGNYRLEAEFTRHNGTEGIGMVVPVGDKHVNLASTATSLWVGTGGVKRSLTTGRRYRLGVEVSITGDRASVQMLLDGKFLAGTSGEVSRFRVPSHLEVSQPGRPALFANESSATFHRVDLTMTDGKAYLIADGVKQ